MGPFLEWEIGAFVEEIYNELEFDFEGCTGVSEDQYNARVSSKQPFKLLREMIQNPNRNCIAFSNKMLYKLKVKINSGKITRHEM